MPRTRRDDPDDGDDLPEGVYHDPDGEPAAACPYCREPVPDDARFCGRCENPLPAAGRKPAWVWVCLALALAAVVLTAF